MGRDVPGFEIALPGALSEPITIAGVPRTAAILIGALTAVMSLGLQVPWLGLPTGTVLHGTALWATRTDPYALEVLARHLRQRAYLEG